MKCYRKSWLVVAVLPLAALVLAILVSPSFSTAGTSHLEPSGGVSALSSAVEGSYKAANLSMALPGTLVTYTIALRNGGDTPLVGVLVTDTLPSLVTYADGTLSATQGEPAHSGGTVTWSGDIGVGGSVDIAFGAVISNAAPLGTSIVNTAIIGAGGAEISRSASLKVDGWICNVAKEGGPVLSTGASSSWDEDDVWGPAVLQVGNTYVMWYSGDNGSGPARIGRAVSTNGVAWMKEPEYPVLWPTQSWESGDVMVGSVISDAGQYKMWYTGSDSSGAYRIGYATSADGISWIKHGGNPVLTTGAAGSWDDKEVWAPSVVKVDGTYHLWYTGYDGTAPRIGHATSSNGTDWSKDPADPVLGLGEPGAWDWLEIYGPSVTKVGDRYVLWYSGRTLPQAWQTGYAESTNGSHWVRGDMVIPEGAPGAFDDDSADHAYALLDGTRFGIWYSGYDESRYTIGYATAELCDASSSVMLPHVVYLPAILRNWGAQYCPPYYRDDFGDPTSGWPASDNADRSFGYVGGQYQIWLKRPSWGWMVTPGAKATDFAAAVSAHRVSGGGGAYGFIFGLNADWSEYYEVIVDQKYYSIWRYDDGDWTPVQNWTPSDHVRTGTDWNRLKVLRNGAAIAFYANDHHLTTVYDSSWMGFRRIGLVAYAPDDGPVDVRLDDFALYPADCGARAAGVQFEMEEADSHPAPLAPRRETAP